MQPDQDAELPQDEQRGEPSRPEGVTLAREEIAVSTPIRVTGGVRLRKVVVTELVTTTVEVRREELVIDDLGPAELTLRHTHLTGGQYELHDHEFDIVLCEERVIVTTEVVPIERVHVRKRVVLSTVTVTDTQAEEHAVVDVSSEPPR